MSGNKEKTTQWGSVGKYWGNSPLEQVYPCNFRRVETKVFPPTEAEIDEIILASYKDDAAPMFSGKQAFAVQAMYEPAYCCGIIRLYEDTNEAGLFETIYLPPGEIVTIARGLFGINAIDVGVHSKVAGGVTAAFTFFFD